MYSGCSWPAAHWLATETTLVGQPLAEFQARYTWGAEIGRGTFGRVYDACGQNGATLAIKVVVMDSSGVQEAHVQSRLKHPNIRLKHPNILPLLDAWASPYYAVLALPRRSTTLHRYVSSLDGQLRQQVRDICVQMSKAIAYMHGKGVLHRDVHASNVLLSSHGGTSLSRGQPVHVEISDFGKAQPVPLTALWFCLSNFAPQSCFLRQVPS